MASVSQGGRPADQLRRPAARAADPRRDDRQPRPAHLGGRRAGRTSPRSTTRTRRRSSMRRRTCRGKSPASSSGEEAIKKMTIGKGLKVELFASEKEFPELVNPVQMAFDTQGPALGRGLEELSALAAEDADGRQAAHPRGHQRRRQGGQAHGLRRRPQQSHRLRVLQRRRARRAGAEPGLPQGHERRRQVRHQGDHPARLRLGRHAPHHQQLHVRSAAARSTCRKASSIARRSNRRGVRSRARPTAASIASSRGRGSSKPTCR